MKLLLEASEQSGQKGPQPVHISYFSRAIMEEGVPFLGRFTYGFIARRYAE